MKVIIYYVREEELVAGNPKGCITFSVEKEKRGEIRELAWFVASFQEQRLRGRESYNFFISPVGTSAKLFIM